MERKDNADYVNACARLVVEGTAPFGKHKKVECYPRLHKPWPNPVSANMHFLKVYSWDVHD